MLGCNYLGVSLSCKTDALLVPSGSQQVCSVSEAWQSAICSSMNFLSLFLEFLQLLFNALSLACLSWWSAVEHCSLRAYLPLSLLSWSKGQENSPSSLEALPHRVLWKHVKAQNKCSEHWNEFFWVLLRFVMLRQLEKRICEMSVEAYLVWGCWGLLWRLQEVKRFKLPPFFSPHIFFPVSSWKYSIFEQLSFLHGSVNLIVILGPLG